MGFLVPIFTAVGSAILGTGAAASAGAGITAAVGAATTATTILGAASSVKALTTGAPKPPAVSPVALPTAIMAPPIAAPNPIAAIGNKQNTSLAALSPGFALGGTSSFLGGSPAGSTKKLLGQ